MLVDPNAGYKKYILEQNVSDIGTHNCQEIGDVLSKVVFELTGAVLEKACTIATLIRNKGLLPSIEVGTTIIAANKKLNLWNAALQSSYFHAFQRFTLNEISFTNYDQQALSWLMDYLEAPENVRTQQIKQLPIDLATQISVLADMFFMPNLRKKLEIKILKEAPLPHTFFENLSNLEIRGFNFFNSFIFLIELLAFRVGKSPTDENIQIKAIGILLSNPEKKVCLKLLESDLSYLSSLRFEKGLHLDFFIDHEWKVSHEDCDELIKFAEMTSCSYFKIDLLKIKLKQLECSSLRPSSKTMHVDGLKTDNYFPGVSKTGHSENYCKQKLFFESPFPYEKLGLVAFLKKESQKAISLIKKFPEIDFGLSFTSELIFPNEKVSNVTLLAFEGSPPLEIESKNYIDLLNCFPKCKVLVINDKWLNFFAKYIELSKFSVWKNLQGTAQKCSRKGFEFDWVKTVSYYKEEEIKRAINTPKDY